MTATANDWIKTDRDAVVSDLARLGISQAAEYQMGLISDRQAAGDTRWDSITLDEMQATLLALANECAMLPMILSSAAAAKLSPSTKDLVGAIVADASMSTHAVERVAQAKLGAVRLVNEPVVDRDDEDTVTYLIVLAR